MSEQRKGHWIQTYTGRKFYPADPRPEDIVMADIVQGLSNCCRFAGQLDDFYSVAQHSVLVSNVVQNLGGTVAEIRYGLLHDASEAYIGDVTWPLKHCEEMAGYREIEAKVEAVIAQALRLVPTMPEIVKHADLVLCATEKRDLMLMTFNRLNADRLPPAFSEPWHCDTVQPTLDRIRPVSAKEARKMFLDRLQEC